MLTGNLPSRVNFCLSCLPFTEQTWMIIDWAAIARLLPIALEITVRNDPYSNRETTKRYLCFLHTTTITRLENMLPLYAKNTLIPLIFTCSWTMLQLRKGGHRKVIDGMRKALWAKFWLPRHSSRHSNLPSNNTRLGQWGREVEGIKETEWGGIKNTCEKEKEEEEEEEEEAKWCDNIPGVEGERSSVSDLQENNGAGGVSDMEWRNCNWTNELIGLEGLRVWVLSEHQPGLLRRERRGEWNQKKWLISWLIDWLIDLIKSGRARIAGVNLPSLLLD